MKLRLWITLLCVGVCSLTATADSKFPLADRLPGETLLYIGWAGQNEAFDASLLGELMGKEELKDLFGMIEGFVAEQAPPEAAEATAHALAMADIVWRHPAALHVSKVAMPEPPEEDAEEAGPPPMGPDIVAAVLVDLGDDRAAFAEHLDALLAMAEEELPLEETVVGDIACRAIVTPAGPLTLGYMGDVLFLAFGETTPQLLVDMTAGASLAGNAKFLDHMGAISGDAVQAAFYLDVEGVRNTVAPLLPPAPPADAYEQGHVPPSAHILGNIDAIWKAVGVDRATVLAGATGVDGKMLHSKARLFTPAPHQGMLMLYAGQPIDESDLDGIPADVDLLAVVNLSAASVFDELVRQLADFPVPPGEPALDEMFKEGLGEAEEELGFSIRDGLLASLGDTWTICSAPSLGGFLTGTYISVDVEDTAKLAAVLGRIEALITGEDDQQAEDEAEMEEEYGYRPSRPEFRIGSLTTDVAEIRYVECVNARYSPMPFAPAWSVADGRLYVTAFPQVLKTVLDRKPAALLADAKPFKQYRQKLSGDVCMVSYANTPKVVRQVYNVLLVAWTMASVEAREEGFPLAHTLLPALDVIETYLLPELQTVANDAEGITFQWYGSIPMGGLSSIFNAMGTGSAAMLPRLVQARHQAKRATSMAQLNGIGKAIMLYEESFGESPTCPEDLIAESLVDPSAFRSPNNSSPAPEFIDGELVGEIDYVIFFDMYEADGDLIMAYEKPELYGNNGTCYLLVSGIVQRTEDMAEFEELLEQTQEARGTGPGDEDGF